MFIVKPRRARLLAGVCLAAALSACSSMDVPGVYRIDIQQGNILTEEMLGQLEPGMDKRKVRFILGTPSISDAFDQDRWSYVYSFQPGSGHREQRIVTLLFEEDRLVGLEGDVKPGSGQARSEKRDDLVVDVPRTRRSRGILSGVIERFGRDRDAPPAAPTAATDAAPATGPATPEAAPATPPAVPDAGVAEPESPATEASVDTARKPAGEPPAAREGGGFFRRLLDRFRPTGEKESEPSESVDPSPEADIEESGG